MGLFDGGRRTEWVEDVARSRGLTPKTHKGSQESWVTFDSTFEGVYWSASASAYIDRGVERRSVKWGAALLPRRREDCIEVRYQPTSGLIFDDELAVGVQLAVGLGKMLFRKVRGEAQQPTGSTAAGPAAGPAPRPTTPGEPAEPTFHDLSGLLDAGLRHDLRWWPVAATNLDTVHLRPQECNFILEYYQNRNLRLRTHEWWDGPERLNHILDLGERLITTLRPISDIKT